MEINTMNELKELVEMLTRGIITEKLLSDKTQELNLAWFEIGKGNKIAAIKHYRAATGFDLKESKEHIDKLFKDYNVHWRVRDEMRFQSNDQIVYTDSDGME